jgi:RNA polymerase sigma-70 factor (sigma-E family)
MVETRAVATGTSGGLERAGDRLEELYVRHAPAALRLAYFLTGDRDLAQDLVQDAFVRVAGGFQHLRVPDAFDAYLRRTIVNLFTSDLRRKRLERLQHQREHATAPREHRDVDPAERDRMWRALQTLPPRQRAAVVLRYYEDLSEREAAGLLGCSEGALNQLIVRGMTALRAEIGDDER